MPMAELIDLAVMIAWYAKHSPHTCAVTLAQVWSGRRNTLVRAHDPPGQYICLKANFRCALHSRPEVSVGM